MTDLQKVWKRGSRARVRLYLENEAPRIGSGWRTVDVHVGNRRVTLRTPNGRTAKITRDTFEKVAHSALLPASGL